MEFFKFILKFRSEDVVVVEGVVNFILKVKLGFEILFEKIVVLNRVEMFFLFDLIGKVKVEFDIRFDNCFMDLRRFEVMVIFKICLSVFKVVRDFFYENGFIEIYMFKIIVIVIEGGMEFFLMKYFEEDVFFV